MSDNYKIISISQKRQITIPQKYFSRFRFGGHAKVSMLESGILIEPAENISISNGEFDVQILQDLIQEGLSGEELVNVFKERQKETLSAIRAIKEEARNIARGEAEFDKLEDVFGEN